jgi:transposase-like protein
MDQAVKAVVRDRKSVRRATMQYDVPRSTLFDWVSGRVQPVAVSGSIKCLTSTEEAKSSWVCQVEVRDSGPCTASDG